MFTMIPTYGNTIFCWGVEESPDIFLERDNILIFRGCFFIVYFRPKYLTFRESNSDKSWIVCLSNMLNVDLCTRLPTCTRRAGSGERVDTSLDQEDISSPLFQDNAESGCTDVRRVQQDFKYFKAYETLKRPWSWLADLKAFPLRRIRSYHRNPRLESLESDQFDM